jgi:hypothetical protein
MTGRSFSGSIVGLVRYLDLSFLVCHHHHIRLKKLAGLTGLEIRPVWDSSQFNQLIRRRSTLVQPILMLFNKKCSFNRYDNFMVWASSGGSVGFQRSAYNRPNERKDLIVSVRNLAKFVNFYYPEIYKYIFV